MVITKGDRVRITRCEQCGRLVGKIAIVKNVSSEGLCQLNLGRGRPSKDRPEFFAVDNLERLSTTEEKTQEVAEESNA